MFARFRGDGECSYLCLICNDARGGRLHRSTVDGVASLVRLIPCLEEYLSFEFFLELNGS